MNQFESKTLVCFSHLRWDFVYQRPQHLISRFAKIMQVIYVEEPVHDTNSIYFTVLRKEEKLWQVVPHIPAEMDSSEAEWRQGAFLSTLLRSLNITRYICWYYTPMALSISTHLEPELVVYDCMDELTGFKFAPTALREFEAALFSIADVVFTGGYSLFEAKKNRHHNIHPFPSSIDHEHFRKARFSKDEPPDQIDIKHPRFGFYGVIDERMDLDYLKAIAIERPDWQFILIGPLAKIEEKDTPRLANIHYLGKKEYKELPQYLAGWDVAIMPFALNESTRYISPTKTPEYLAAGVPVISTPILDVVKEYSNVVHIAATAGDFIQVVENGICRDQNWLETVDDTLKDNSWDITWQRMVNIMEETLGMKNGNYPLKYG